MGKNLIIIVLLVLVFVMFFANVKKAKELFDETRRRIKHQLDLANTLETEVDSESSSSETTTGTVIGDEAKPPGNEEAKPAVQA